MSENQRFQPESSVSFCSSLKDGTWHDLTGPHSFERWHFDAVSDDGREALVITFYDNYVLSPRYYEHQRSNAAVNGDGANIKFRFPALSFVYSVDGKTVLSSVHEYRQDEFKASQNNAECLLGKSSFRVDTAEYGSGFVTKIDMGTIRNRSIRAELEWLSVESDLLHADTKPAQTIWNIVSPRSDVSGRITLIGRSGKTQKMIHFRGTGYHDHICSKDSANGSVGPRHWGRAHFNDTTVVFEHHPNSVSTPSKLILIRDGTILERNVSSETTEVKRDRYGLKIPRRISLVSDDNIRLRVKPSSVIRSGFSEVKMLSEMTLMLRDGKPRKTFGITEFIEPGRMKNRLVRWLSDLAIGKERRSPLF